MEVTAHFVDAAHGTPSVRCPSLSDDMADFRSQRYARFTLTRIIRANCSRESCSWSGFRLYVDTDANANIILQKSFARIIRVVRCVNDNSREYLANCNDNLLIY